ncbi:MAG: hypothetical protein JXA21_02365 [Anaerolineae bacterium]|nr:hypothetical protein [Anaerolineae bacterium]
MKAKVVLAIWVALVMMGLAGSTLISADAPPISLWYETDEIAGTYTDLTLQRDFAPGGSKYLANGDFHAWDDDAPAGWTLYRAERGGHDVHWSRVVWGNASGAADYALSLLVRDSHRYYGGAYGAACVGLDVPKEGDYWVTLHTTAWGSESIPYNSVAWYAITRYYRPWYIEESDWRELYAEPLSCRNSAGQCGFTARRELVHIVPGDTLCLQAGMKFREYNAWTVWVWDDITVVATDSGATGFVEEGTVKWKAGVAR